MSFFRHREIFRSDVIRSVRERRNRRSPAHRLDEFPVGYSSTSCTPALLASASPIGIHSATQARRRQRSFQPTANCVLTFCATPGDNRRTSGYTEHICAKRRLYYRLHGGLLGRLKIVAGGSSPSHRASARGKLFEKLMTQVLRQNGYLIDRIPSVNYAGMEVDIEGRASVTDIPLYAECKCYETEVDSTSCRRSAANT